MSAREQVHRTTAVRYKHMPRVRPSLGTRQGGQLVTEHSCRVAELRPKSPGPSPRHSAGEPEDTKNERENIRDAKQSQHRPQHCGTTLLVPLLVPMRVPMVSVAALMVVLSATVRAGWTSTPARPRGSGYA